MIFVLEVEETMSYRLPDYAKRARRRFCAGKRNTTPAELVLSGKRTLEEWVEVLEQERARTARQDLKRAPIPRDDFKSHERNF
jgi:hypothetical protein